MFWSQYRFSKYVPCETIVDLFQTLSHFFNLFNTVTPQEVDCCIYPLNWSFADPGSLRSRNGTYRAAVVCPTTRLGPAENCVTVDRCVDARELRTFRRIRDAIISPFNNRQSLASTKSADDIHSPSLLAE